MKALVVTLVLAASTSSALAYPLQCTAQYGYTASCCAASYARHAEGTMDNSKRIAELAVCTAKASAKKK
ncbi:hypothetical protein [Bradyrhizobium guangzhouense]|uniref:hypothetical protein n=1 Tax=Bradyrhizobium guangzhouense TaxID=1325095 RepID=UPI0010098D06|nr:hypothetical protein [Bradyrhizobium guangzhouense]